MKRKQFAAPALEAVAKKPMPEAERQVAEELQVELERPSVAAGPGMRRRMRMESEGVDPGAKREGMVASGVLPKPYKTGRASWRQ